MSGEEGMEWKIQGIVLLSRGSGPCFCLPETVAGSRVCGQPCTATTGSRTCGDNADNNHNPLPVPITKLVCNHYFDCLCAWGSPVEACMGLHTTEDAAASGKWKQAPAPLESSQIQWIALLHSPLLLKIVL